MLSFVVVTSAPDASECWTPCRMQCIWTWRQTTSRLWLAWAMLLPPPQFFATAAATLVLSSRWPKTFSEFSSFKRRTDGSYCRACRGHASGSCRSRPGGLAAGGHGALAAGLGHHRSLPHGPAEAQSLGPVLRILLICSKAHVQLASTWCCMLETGTSIEFICEHALSGCCSPAS